MKKIALIIAVLAIVSCQNTRTEVSESEKLLASIDSLETILFAESEKPADTKSGMGLIKMYAKYYRTAQPKDSVAVDMLFKAAEVSMGIGQGPAAVKYFSTVAEHENYSKQAEALFLAGFCEENVNQDTGKARFYYEKFLDQHPQHKLAEDAEFSIKNMQMTDEELIELFEENLKKES